MRKAYPDFKQKMHGSNQRILLLGRNSYLRMKFKKFPQNHIRTCGCLSTFTFSCSFLCLQNDEEENPISKKEKNITKLKSVNPVCAHTHIHKLLFSLQNFIELAIWQ